MGEIFAQELVGNLNRNVRKEKMFNILEEYATQKKLINYKELYDSVGLNTENPDDRNTGSNILGEINHISIKNKDILLSAIVTLSKEQNPAVGFFNFAKEFRGFEKTNDEIEAMAFWAEEIKKVFKAYAE